MVPENKIPFCGSFSALDFKTDAELRKALSQETKDATVLTIVYVYLFQQSCLHLRR